ncbi:prepilin-type cleavage/methylation protein [Vagococcus coleopterorum]|uniref:Prepilin-type cleavage/methylation protein n=1 Tax=Vagococcus coleopterorum TaxID=2714946 RepID=A0A6G8ALC8_9ENTE|nr:prepilin-type cleavage/methylation protein [Vagococcus coleopterorum]QIL45806.1 prepilin-type cleavage/methylation protein [Vagococcus coleopterorum]
MIVEENESCSIKKLIADETGLTLMELLGTLVVLTIIAGIGVTTIGKVIQHNKEDVGISNVQQAMNAALIFQTITKVRDTDKNQSSFTLKEVIEAGYLEVPITTWERPDKVYFIWRKNGSLLMTDEVGKQLKAGMKRSLPFEKLSTNQIYKLSREQLWGP